jgi:hypothetical protein
LLKTVIFVFVVSLLNSVRLASVSLFLLLTLSASFAFLSGRLGLVDNDSVSKLLLVLANALVGLSIVFILS